MFRCEGTENYVMWQKILTRIAHL